MGHFPAKEGRFFAHIWFLASVFCRVFAPCSTLMSQMVMEKARKVCPERIETRRKPKNIENEIKQISLHVSLEDE